MKKALKILAIAFVAVGFVACDEVSKAVDSATQKGKQIAQSNNSGDSSTNATANNAVKSGSGVKAITEDSVCKTSTNIDDYSYAPDYGSAIDSIAVYSGVGDKQYWANELVRYYGGEIKKSDKETICLSMPMVITDYLKIDLTPQEIERFERFLVEKAADVYSLYEYEEGKRVFLNILKLLKYHNKLDEWYDTINKEGCEYTCFEYFSGLTNLSLEEPYLNEKPIIMAKKFVYDKDVGGAFSAVDGGTLYFFGDINSCAKDESRQNHKECQATIKWIESIQKQHQ